MLNLFLAILLVLPLIYVIGLIVFLFFVAVVESMCPFTTYTTEACTLSSYESSYHDGGPPNNILFQYLESGWDMRLYLKCPNNNHKYITLLGVKRPEDYPTNMQLLVTWEIGCLSHYVHKVSIPK